ncbi:MAG: acid sugar phosphatase [Herpetosiphonaceae bacterium]|nr:MAG: acid sugar phosphatase [Herpetosiphonaceae bacterium]
MILHTDSSHSWLRGLGTLLLDIDGVLHRSWVPLPGAVELPAALTRLGIRYMCVTNNATRTPDQVSKELHAIGIPIPASQIMTSALATAHELRKRATRGTRVYTVGMRGLHEAIFGDGYFVLDTYRPEYVVVGADFELVYEKLRVACLAIRAGARFIGTNPDKTFPTEEGLIPGCGAILAALEAATGITPEIIGKPKPALFHAALEQLGVSPEAAAMVGDRLDTDIAGGHAAGLRTIFVGTGVDTIDDARLFPSQPDLVVVDLGELIHLLQDARAHS